MPGVVGEQRVGGRVLVVDVLIALADREAGTAAAGSAAGTEALKEAERRRGETRDLAGAGVAADGVRADRQGRVGGVQAGAQQERQEGRVVGTEIPAVRAADLFRGGEEADQPVEAVVGAGQADFLGQVVDREAIVAVVEAIGDVGTGVVDVLAEGGLPLTPRGDRGQGAVDGRNVDGGLERDAAIGDFLVGRAVGIAGAQEGQRAVAGGRRTLARAGREAVDEGIGVGGPDLRADAAVFVPAREVADQAEGDVVAGQPQQLATNGAEVLVVVVNLGTRAVTGVDGHEAVTDAAAGVQAEGQGVADRAGDRTRSAHGTVVADVQFGVELRRERRGLGDDVDDAGRGVLAEQRALRALQDLDTAHFAQVAEADRVARAVDAVDDHADRAFQTGVVTHRTDAADAGGGRGFRRGRGDRHARRQDLQVLDVADAGVLQRLGRQAGDHDRHVLKVLLTLLGGDDDVVDGLRAALAGILGGRGTGEAEGAGPDNSGGDGSAKKVGKAHCSSPTWARLRVYGNRGGS